MPLIRIEPHRFRVLRDAFEFAATHPKVPFDPALLAATRGALTRAAAALLPGLPILLRLTGSELVVLACCLEVGGHGLASIGGKQSDAIVSLLRNAARTDA